VRHAEVSRRYYAAQRPRPPRHAGRLWSRFAPSRQFSAATAASIPPVVPCHTCSVTGRPADAGTASPPDQEIPPHGLHHNPSRNSGRAVQPSGRRFCGGHHYIRLVRWLYLAAVEICIARWWLGLANYGEPFVDALEMACSAACRRGLLGTGPQQYAATLRCSWRHGITAAWPARCG